MRFIPTEVDGAFLVEPEPRADNRGWFARVICDSEFAQEGLTGRFRQVNVTWNALAGTLRGLHVQQPPHAEAKLIRCLRGSLFDVALDVRPDSPTRGRHVGAILTAANRRMLFVPEGCAHGYQSLEDDVEVLHLHSVPYAPGSETGFRWDDPAFGIQWPINPPILSDKDRAQLPVASDWFATQTRRVARIARVAG